MSARALKGTAAVLFVLCVAAAALLSRRLGWWDAPAPIEWTFVNPTLSVARGQRVVLRPIVEGVRPLRYTFVLPVTDPLPDDPVAPVPHLRAGVEEYEEGEWAYRPPVEAVAFCQMGALTPQEWLTEIRPILESGGAGGARMLLKATFGHRSGATVAYYHDPMAPVPGLGWTRNEMVAEGRPPELYFATDGGLAILPAATAPDPPGPPKPPK
ncbi:MAG TPA: hypothetical protein VFY93_10780 [Planctomycetota bacterium]|nr:hypothetical protein [Planctomycetota bacterium]